MSKHSRRYRQKLDIKSMEDAYDYDLDDFDLDDLSRDIYSTDWGDNDFEPQRLSARREIERRGEMKKLYSELDDWQEFGLSQEL